MVGKYYKVDKGNELYHARSHQYIRREGSPGNYRYYYSLGGGKEATTSTDKVGSSHSYSLGGGKSATTTTGDGKSSSSSSGNELGGNIIERAQKAIENGKRAVSKWWESLKNIKFNTIK